jgi:hypothetical protein
MFSKNNLKCPHATNATTTQENMIDYMVWPQKQYHTKLQCKIATNKHMDFRLQTERGKKYYSSINNLVAVLLQAE